MTTTDWAAVVANGGRLPDGLSQAEAIAELSEAARSPDPAVRDEQAFEMLARLIPDLDSSLLSQLGDAMAARFTDPEVAARTFAPLILSRVVARGAYNPAWVPPFQTWYVSETDLRGWDESLGWLHAVAHGADLLGALGRHPEVAPAQMLELAVSRLLARTDYLFAHQEDDRLACAMALCLTREELTEGEATAWMDPVAADFAAGPPGPVPPYAANTMRTLHMLYVLADRGIRFTRGQAEPFRLPHAVAIKQRLADVIRATAPPLG